MSKDDKEDDHHKMEAWLQSLEAALDGLDLPPAQTEETKHWINTARRYKQHLHAITQLDNCLRRDPSIKTVSLSSIQLTFGVTFSIRNYTSMHEMAFCSAKNLICMIHDAICGFPVKFRPIQDHSISKQGLEEILKTLAPVLADFMLSRTEEEARRSRINLSACINTEYSVRVLPVMKDVILRVTEMRVLWLTIQTMCDCFRNSIKALCERRAPQQRLRALHRWIGRAIKLGWFASWRVLATADHDLIDTMTEIYSIANQRGATQQGNIKLPAEIVLCYTKIYNTIILRITSLNSAANGMLVWCEQMPSTLPSGRINAEHPAWHKLRIAHSLPNDFVGHSVLLQAPQFPGSFSTATGRVWLYREAVDSGPLGEFAIIPIAQLLAVVTYLVNTRVMWPGVIGRDALCKLLVNEYLDHQLATQRIVKTSLGVVAQRAKLPLKAPIV